MAEPYVGEIKIFAGNFAPVGWFFCDGSLQSIQDYDTLYALIGTTYGGDGTTTFAVPDFRGRIPVHQGNGSGLTSRIIGQEFGEESETLSVFEMPSHNHGATATNSAATTITAGPSVTYGAITQPNDIKGVYSLYTTLTPPAVKAFTLSSNALAPSGAAMSHNNIMLSSTVNFIIAYEGVYPSQS